MKISFDLDDTLIPSKHSAFPRIRRNFLQKLLNTESLRLGTIELMRILKSEGHELGIYTTSYRTKLSIRLLFFLYGIPVSFVVNEYLNRKCLNAINLSALKFPPVFDIDLHVDDSHGVALEGQHLGFQSIIVEKNDLDWVATVLSGVNAT